MSRRVQLIDLTQGDEPIITYIDRPVLGELTAEQASKKRANKGKRARGRENLRPEYVNRIRPDDDDDDVENRPVRRRRTEMRDAIQGLGTKRQNPWISFVKGFAKQNNMSYRDALRNPATKKAYVKGGKFRFKDLGKAIASPFTIGKVNPFEAGYNLGHDKIAPAIFGKK